MWQSFDLWNKVSNNLGMLQMFIRIIALGDSFSRVKSCCNLIFLAIATVVTIAEILKNNGLAVDKKITTATVDIKDDPRGHPIQKAKIEILLGKTENFDELMAAAAEERGGVDGEEQS
ncbi:NHP2-like protein 1-like [Hibiscus syriacus]|uniref:NHP2-like protein 1-like n=1 Tax=Hibiscus syriacus TaxID=106335 RepID=A0A6A3B5R3_HIBSY|nr:uncharacterized protein At2g34160-like isoform X2 [Hibiscus syriacus]KAE8710399.1 NHP2-like protein 1-like [Hibiscus syriacus]